MIHLVEDSRIKYRLVHNDGMFAHTVASLAQHSDYPNAEIHAHNSRDAMPLFATQDIHNREETTIPQRNGFNIDDPLLEHLLLRTFIHFRNTQQIAYPVKHGNRKQTSRRR